MLRLTLPSSALAVAGASLALVACGSSDNGSSSASGASTGSSGGNATRNADFQKFQQCLKDNGVALPNRARGGSNAAPPNTGQPPQGGGQGGFFSRQNSDPKVAKAMQACAKYRPQGRGPGGYGKGSGNRPQTNIAAFKPYLTCLKDQGLDVKVSDGFNALRGLKASDPKVQAAFKACQSKLPQRPGGSSAAPGNTGTT
jgi:hypothetical protein